MYKVVNCSRCGNPLHIHKKQQGFIIKNKCSCMSLLEVREYNLDGTEDYHYFSLSELSKFLKDIGKNWLSRWDYRRLIEQTEALKTLYY